MAPLNSNLLPRTRGPAGNSGSTGCFGLAKLWGTPRHSKSHRVWSPDSWFRGHPEGWVIQEKFCSDPTNHCTLASLIYMEEHWLHSAVQVDFIVNYSLTSKGRKILTEIRKTLELKSKEWKHKAECWTPLCPSSSLCLWGNCVTQNCDFVLSSSWS